MMLPDTVQVWQLYDNKKLRSLQSCMITNQTVMLLLHTPDYFHNKKKKVQQVPALKR